jgi:hypothetical protein
MLTILSGGGIITAADSSLRTPKETNIFAENAFLSSRQSDTTSDNPSSSSANSPSTTIGFAPAGTSCSEDTQTLLVNEDVRTQLQVINLAYLQHASIQKACHNNNNDGDGTTTLSSATPSLAAGTTNCNFNFLQFPNNLDEVCEKHGALYDEREHSIQCHNPSNSKELLYYQFDHFPSCLPITCNNEDILQIVTHQMESVRRALEKDSGMVCYADFDILRHAASAAAAVSVGGYGFLTWTMASIATAVSFFVLF